MNRKKILLIIIVLVLALTGCSGDSTTKKALEEGKKALSSREYDKAIGLFELAAKEKSGEEAKKIVKIIKDYKEGLKLFEENNLEEAKKRIDKIDKDYKKYAIKKDVDKLKGDIKKRIEVEVEIQKKMQEIEDLIAAANYTDAKLKIEELLNSNQELNKSQREQLDIDMKKSDEEIQKLKEKEEQEKAQKIEKSKSYQMSVAEAKEVMKRYLKASNSDYPNYLETHEVVYFDSLNKTIDGVMYYAFDIRSYIGGAADTYFVNSSSGEVYHMYDIMPIFP